MKSKFFLLGFTVILATLCLACFTTPVEQIVPADELVKRTNTIVLAMAVKAEADITTGIVKYSFVSMENIKGRPSDQIEILGVSMSDAKDLSNFNHHQEESFWKNEGGRSYHDTDCKIHPSFAVGSVYLLFLDSPFHNKSFESIVRYGEQERDKWLSWVNKFK